MANTFTQLYIQFVFAVQNRESLIQSKWKIELYKYITGIIQNHKHKLIAINGMPNHLHVFIEYKPHQPIPALLQFIKGCSSTWINRRGFTNKAFNWQKGYGAFSYSHSHIDNVVQYILNQEKHHKKQTFKEEYIQLLERFNIDYNEQYIFKDIAR
ncbi:IS200/IS605 family transposase [candidate division KSB1 bacterium]|nr:IS200/IS605 family transposase [candidate division KSB1 bacterium]